MSAPVPSRHAETRMRQRGFRYSDLVCVLDHGSLIGDDTYFLSRKDVDREIRQHKREIQRLERLKNSKIVIKGETIVTCCRSHLRDQKRLLRRKREAR